MYMYSRSYWQVHTHTTPTLSHTASLTRDAMVMWGEHIYEHTLPTYVPAAGLGEMLDWAVLDCAGVRVRSGEAPAVKEYSRTSLHTALWLQWGWTDADTQMHTYTQPSMYVHTQTHAHPPIHNIRMPNCIYRNILYMQCTYCTYMSIGLLHH